MRVNPEELVELTNHGSMNLRYAVARAMLLLPAERRRATIVRKTEPTVLRFKAIKDLSNAFARPRRPPKRGVSKPTHSLPRSQRRKPSSRSRAA